MRSLALIVMDLVHSDVQIVAQHVSALPNDRNRVGQLPTVWVNGVDGYVVLILAHSL